MLKTSTMKPFALGDIFLGCSYLNNDNRDKTATPTSPLGSISVEKVDLLNHRPELQIGAQAPQLRASLAQAS